MSAARHARAIALLPGTAAVLVPALILLAAGTSIGCGLAGALAALPVIAGAALIAAGFALWLWTARLLATIGGGTLAPWDATRHLVVEGPYAHARNPMITAVLMTLIGEASLLGSLAIVIWCAAFLFFNWAFFVLVEEPGLARRFGEQYDAYRANVPRWIPRLTAWTVAGGPRSGARGQRSARVRRAARRARER